MIVEVGQEGEKGSFSVVDRSTDTQVTLPDDFTTFKEESTVHAQELEDTLTTKLDNVKTEVDAALEEADKARRESDNVIADTVTDSFGTQGVVLYVPTLLLHFQHDTPLSGLSQNVHLW
jgi:hypothetical protein